MEKSEAEREECTKNRATLEETIETIGNECNSLIDAKTGMGVVMQRINRERFELVRKVSRLNEVSSTLHRIVNVVNGLVGQDVRLDDLEEQHEMYDGIVDESISLLRSAFRYCVSISGYILFS